MFFPTNCVVYHMGGTCCSDEWGRAVETLLPLSRGGFLQTLGVSGALALQKWILALLLPKVSSQSILCTSGQLL